MENEQNQRRLHLYTTHEKLVVLDYVICTTLNSYFISMSLLSTL